MSPVVEQVTGREIFTILFERNLETMNSFDEFLGLNRRLDFCNAVGQVYWVLKPSFQRLFDEGQQRIPAWYLLWKCANDITGCFQLLRLGYYGMVLAHLRTLIENVAVGLAIAVDPNASRNYEKGRLDFKAAIRRHNKLYPGTRELYASLHKFTHPSAATLGSVVGQTESHAVIGAGYLPEKEWVYQLAFDGLLGSCRILLTTCYLAFPEYIHLGGVTVFRIVAERSESGDDPFEARLRELHLSGEVDFRTITKDGVEILRPPSSHPPDTGVPSVYARTKLTEQDDEVVRMAMAAPPLSERDSAERLLLRQLATAAQMENSVLYTEDPAILGGAGPILSSTGLQVCLPSELRVILRGRGVPFPGSRSS